MNKAIIALALMMFFVSPSILLAFRDPTLPQASVNVTPVKSSAFVLTAIISRQGQKSAIINGSYQTVGDTIFGQSIVSIGKNTVKLIGPSGKITLFLFGQPIKKMGHVQCKRNLDLCRNAVD